MTWAERYQRHIRDECRSCRMATNPLLFRAEQIKVPDDLCPTGHALYLEMAKERFRQIASNLDKPTVTA